VGGFGREKNKEGDGRPESGFRRFRLPQ